MSEHAVARLRARARRLFHAAVAAALPGGWRLFPVLATVEGFLFPHEAVFLRQLARDAPGQAPVVEIGSYCGLSTLCLARGAAGRAAPCVFAIDPHERGTEARLRRNLRRFGATSRVEVVVAASLEAAARWSGEVRVLFIDGSHEEPSVRADFAVWTPFVVPGGFVLLHDSTEVTPRPGPMAVAREFLREGSRFDACGHVGSISWARRRGASTDWLPRPPLAASLDTLFGALGRWSRRGAWH